MRIACATCRIMRGGARQVTKDLIAPKIQGTTNTVRIFTRVSAYETVEINKQTIQITTALPKWLNKMFVHISERRIPFISSLFDYRNLIVRSKLLNTILSKKIKKFQPDEIIISSFAMSKNISLPKNVPSTVYLHSPMQYIRSHYDEYCQKLHGWKRFLFKTIAPGLRKYDQKQRTYTQCIANSEYTKQLAQEIYNITCTVQYPQIEKEYFIQTINTNPENYYLYNGRLARFVKEVDNIIKLCNKAHTPLIVMGTGPDKKYLQSLAGPTILFIDYPTDKQEQINIIKNSKGLLNITKESFGIATAQAVLLGVPVFGYSQGATAELVEKKSGILVPDKKANTLRNYFQQFITTNRNREYIANTSRKLLQKNIITS